MIQMRNDTRASQERSQGYNRRQFISTALAGAGVLMAHPHMTSGATPRTKKGRATDIITLGNTGIKTTRLALGTGYNGGGRTSAQARLGVESFNRLLRHSLDQGVALVDAADLYGIHNYVRRALEGVKRENYTLSTKIWPRKEFWNSPSGGAKEEVNRFRKELKADVLEICLIHCMTNSDWPQTYKRIRDELSEMKEKGAVKAVGVSCHDYGALKVASEHPWVDVIYARINNVGKEASMDGTPAEISAVLKQARANGKVVVGMKIFGAGELVQPAQKDASLKYVFGNDLVDAITIGMTKPEEVNDTLKRMNRVLKA
jgi:1-deoxyxylulose-5-phosphate synthase